MRLGLGLLIAAFEIADNSSGHATEADDTCVASANKFDPRDVSGLVGFYWSELGTTLDGSNNVTTWAGVLGTEPSPTQATSTKRPAFVTGQVNGRPAIRGDGVDDLLTATNANNITADYTVFWAVKGGGVLNTYFFENGTGSLGNGLVLGNNGTNRSVIHSGVQVHDDAAATTNLEIGCARRGSGEAPTLQIDGSDQTLNNTGSTTFNDPGSGAKLTFFGSAFPLAWMAADAYMFLVYNAKISDADRTKVTSYMQLLYN